MSSSTAVYEIGALVVYRSFYCDALYEVDQLFEDGSLGITCVKKRESWRNGAANPESVRLATKAEIKAKKRLE